MRQSGRESLGSRCAQIDDEISNPVGDSPPLLIHLDGRPHRASVVAPVGRPVRDLEEGLHFALEVLAGERHEIRRAIRFCFVRQGAVPQFGMTLELEPENTILLDLHPDKM